VHGFCVLICAEKCNALENRDGVGSEPGVYKKRLTYLDQEKEMARL
jgi:hypothetical protein